MAIKDFTYTRKDPLENDLVKQAAANQAALGDYQSPQTSIDALNRANELKANPIAEWTGGKYGQALEDQYNAYKNREAFSYDLNGDALYQQYKDKYINQGRLAMQDTIGQASAMTGGYGNSYAATAGNQAYQASLQNLNDIVPQLYQMAYDRYTQEGQEMKDAYSMLNSLYQNEYGEHRDSVSDYNTALDRAINEHYQAENLGFNQWSTKATLNQNAYNAALDFATNESNTDYANKFAIYQQGEQERQASASSNGSNATQKGMNAEDYHTVLYEAQTYENDDDLSNYLNGAVSAGVISLETAQAIFKMYSKAKYEGDDPLKNSMGKNAWMTTTIN